MSLFKNPMILMAVFSLGLIVGMPYLLDNSTYPQDPHHFTFANRATTVDPEAKAEFEAMQKRNPMAANPATTIQNFDLAGWMAGSTSSSSSAPAPAIEAPKTQQSGSRRKG
jgi:hypothetical protein